MSRPRNFVGALLGALLVSGCATSTLPSADSVERSVASDETANTVTCGELLDRVLARERRDEAAGAINAELDLLGDECSTEYWVYIDYISIKMFAETGSDQACSVYRDYDVEPVAIQLAERDGHCSAVAAAASAPPTASWICSYQPTYDRDWHNDVLCSDGAQQHRPYLREWDTYITEDEMRASALEYQDQLNGG